MFNWSTIYKTGIKVGGIEILISEEFGVLANPVQLHESTPEQCQQIIEWTKKHQPELISLIALSYCKNRIIENQNLSDELLEPIAFGELAHPALEKQR